MKRAEMGVGTLIIFISMLLVAAVAAGVLLQTAGSLQEKALSTGQQATTQISTNAETIEVSATDGRDGLLTDFNQLMKLSPGSDEIKLAQVIFTFNTHEQTSTLRYRGTSGICERNVSSGYVTRKQEVLTSDLTSAWYDLTEDLDYDWDYSDRIRLLTNTTIEIEYSTLGAYNYTISDITGASESPVTFNIAEEAINPLNQSYGKIQINGTTNQNNTLLANMITLTPYRIGEGYFTVEYLQTGTNFIAGNLQTGDLIELCYESPEDLGEDEEVRLNLIPKIGTATLTEFVTPDVISTERVYLYP